MRAAGDDGSGAWLTLFVAGLIAVVAAIGYLVYSGAASIQGAQLAVISSSPAAAPSPSPTPSPLPKPVG